MAKKGSGKQKTSASRVSAEDRAQYGEVVDVFRATFGEYELSVAADMSGSDTVRKVTGAASMLSLIGVIVGLLPTTRSYPLLMVSLAIGLIATFVSSRWSDIMKWHLRRTNLGQQVTDGDQRVIVCRDALHVEHGDVVEDLPLSELTGVRSDDEAALAVFSGNRMVFIPREEIGTSRFKAVLDLLKK